MAEKLKKLGLQRDTKYMYFIGNDGNVWRVGAKNSDRKGTPAHKVADAGVKKEKGFLYFLDKDGDVSRAAMKRGSRAV